MGQTVMVDSGDGPHAQTVGGDIPPYRIKTFELELGELQKNDYKTVHHRWAPHLKQEFPSEDDKQSENGHRRLCCGAFSPMLEAFSDGGFERDEAQDINELIGSKGYDFKFFFNRVRDPHFRLPKDHGVIAQYMIDRSAKLQKLADILQLVLTSPDFEGRRKVLILAEFPLITCLVTLFLAALGIKVGYMHSAQKDKQRGEIVSDFNDPTSSTMALVGTYKLLGSGYNLQKTCHALVLLEPASSFNVEGQRIGRLHRLSQKEPQTVFRLFCEGTYDRYREYKSSRKFIPQLISRGSLVFQGDGQSAVNAANALDNSSIIENRADATMRELFGFSRSRIFDEGMGDVNDLVHCQRR